MNQAILITNRKLQGSKKNRRFSNKLSDTLRVAELLDETGIQRFGPRGGKLRHNKKYKHTFKPVLQENETTFFNQVVEQSNDKPWLFFVHGFNQTIEKNLAKARRIQEKYDVNLVVFSWPSRSYSIKYYKMIPKLLKKPTSQLSWVADLGYFFYEEKKKQYKEARQKAESVADKEHLAQAIEKMNTSLFAALKQRHQNVKINLLVHSLGHYLLQCAQPALNQAYNSPVFDSAIFHQGDCLATEHEFLLNLGVVKPENSLVTQNRHDPVLAASGVINSGLDNPQSRLGNHVGMEERPPINYFENSDVYLDGHGLAWRDDIPADELNIYKRYIVGSN